MRWNMWPDTEILLVHVVILTPAGPKDSGIGPHRWGPLPQKNSFPAAAPIQITRRTILASLIANTLLYRVRPHRSGIYKDLRGTCYGELKAPNIVMCDIRDPGHFHADGSNATSTKQMETGVSSLHVVLDDDEVRTTEIISHSFKLKIVFLTTPREQYSYSGIRRHRILGLFCQHEWRSGKKNWYKSRPRSWLQHALILVLVIFSNCIAIIKVVYLGGRACEAPRCKLLTVTQDTGFELAERLGDHQQIHERGWKTYILAGVSLREVNTCI